MKIFEDSTGGKEIIMSLTKEEGRKMIEVYEQYVKGHKRQTKVKATLDFMSKYLPVW